MALLGDTSSARLYASTALAYLCSVERGGRGGQVIETADRKTFGSERDVGIPRDAHL